MRKGFLIMAMGLLALSAPMFGALLIDFGGSVGGTITCSTATCGPTDTVTGLNININTMSVLGAGVHDGEYSITGGVLNFAFTGNPDTSIGTVLTIAGAVGGCINPLDGACLLSNSVPTQTLLTGTTTDSFSYTLDNNAIQIKGNGPDTKSSALLSALGIPSGTQWAFSGFTIGGFALGNGMYTATSTDIGNNSVPEPTSILLLGTVLFGVTYTIRRRNRRA